MTIAWRTGVAAAFAEAPLPKKLIKAHTKAIARMTATMMSATSMPFPFFGALCGAGWALCRCCCPGCCGVCCGAGCPCCA